MRTFRGTICFVVVNIFILILLHFLLAQPSALKILMNEAERGDYDILIIGQSHGSSGYDPYTISDVTGNQVFNLSRRLMPVVNLRYILEEVTTVNNQYKTVILDIDPSYWDDDHSGTSGSDTNLFFRLTGNRRVEYAKNIILKDNYNNAIADYILKPSTIKKIPKNVKCKMSKEYLVGDETAMQSVLSATVTPGIYEYKGRGFNYATKKSYIEWPSWSFDKNNVKEENLEAFKEIVTYCNDNGIELICTQSALPPSRLQNENMDEVHEYFAALCDNYHVPFYDLNYLKEEYLSRTNADYVDDDGHMMGELALRQSLILGRILVSDEKETCFYDTYDEVLSYLEAE